MAKFGGGVNSELYPKRLRPRSPPAAPQQPLADRPLAQRAPGRVVCARAAYTGPAVDRLVGGTSDGARLSHVVREEPADDPLAPLLLDAVDGRDSAEQRVGVQESADPDEIVTDQSYT